MSRFWLAAVIIMVIMLSACASKPESERTFLLPNHMANSAEVVQVEDIADALDRFMNAEGDQLILLPNRLDKSELDYSMESLQVIDRWLADIHTINRLQSGIGSAGESLVLDGRGDNSVVFAGLYMGQVVRAHSDLTWHWQSFEMFLSTNPVFAEHYGRDAGLDAFVLVGPQGAATPINTALKRVVHGKEESVYFIAQLLLKEVDLEKAMASQDLLGMDRADWGG
jgi:hypothetical protein